MSVSVMLERGRGSTISIDGSTVHQEPADFNTTLPNTIDVDKFLAMLRIILARNLAISISI